MKKLHFTVLVSMVLLTPGSRVSAQENSGWIDPVSHTSRYIQVAPDVRLEVLDWGGDGIPLVLLTGAGDTAHVYDDFARKLSNAFHVYGITRRGYGASDFAPLSAGGDTWSNDVIAVLDALGLDSPILAGHSIAGQELSAIGTLYPERVSALIYLDAAYPYAFDNGDMPTFQDIQAVGFPQPAPPTEDDLASFDALGRYFDRVLGFTYPEAELRQRRDLTPEGRLGPRKMSPSGPFLLAEVKQYERIPTPALFIVSSQSPGLWAENSEDPAIQAQISGLNALLEQQARVLAEALPDARVVKLPKANHYVFLSNEAEVLREMADFLSDLP